MGNWSVDPAGVRGVLAGVDAQGTVLETQQTTLDTLVADGSSTLAVDGRTVLSGAWETFFSWRQRVPGMLIHVVLTRATAVSTATSAVAFGDEEMAAEWGIGPVEYYQVF